MLTRRPLYLLACLIAAISFTVAGCDSGDEDEPTLEEILLIGTIINSDFLATGDFQLVATPLDETGAGILSANVAPEVVIDVVNDEPSQGILAQSQVSGINAPSDNTLAVAISLDNSGSMASTDPNRTRVDGAIAFVNTLEATGTPYEAGVFTFGGPRTPPFSVTALLQDYTDNADSLRAAIEQVGASGGTPTYGSLIEVLNYSEEVRPTALNERAIVLLSDGQPGDTHLRPEACQLADSLDSPVYAIGLGPASDLSPNPSPSAVEEMRQIASCSGGAYAGIVEGDVSSVTDIYSSIGTATVQGSLTISVHLENYDVLEANDIVEGLLRLSSGGGESEAHFRFRVPTPAPQRAPNQGITD